MGSKKFFRYSGENCFLQQTKQCVDKVPWLEKKTPARKKNQYKSADIGSEKKHLSNDWSVFVES